MKTIQEYINVSEGWTGPKGDKAYDDILAVWEGMSQEDILKLIWNYYSDRDLQDLYKWMKQDGYFD